MSKRDAVQEAISRASMTMNVSEDVAKALIAAEIHPKLAQVIMNIHHTQQELEKRLMSVDKTLLEMARFMDASANVVSQQNAALEQICKRNNIDMRNLFGPEPDEKS